MSPVDASSCICNGLDALLIVSLAMLTALLLIRRKLRTRSDDPPAQPVSAVVANDTGRRGIDPADYADAAEHQAALDRLSQLPQFRRLADGTLVEWGSGARITPCDCRKLSVAHLMISWSADNDQGIVTKDGLAHYVAYHERVASVLLAVRADRIDRDPRSAGADSRRPPESKEGY